MQVPGDSQRPPHPTTRAFEAVAERLREDLAAGRFPTGDRLPAERALAERFGVSRNTLREALRALEDAGLIRLQKGATGGAFVTGTTGRPVVSGLMDLYRFGAAPPTEIVEAHRWISRLVVREACRRRSEGALAELAANVEATEAAVHARRPTLALEIDFHRVLARATGNSLVVIVVDGLLDILRRLLAREPATPGVDLVASRRRFLACFAAGDDAGAAQAMGEATAAAAATAEAMRGPAVPPGVAAPPRPAA